MRVIETQAMPLGVSLAEYKRAVPTVAEDDPEYDASITLALSSAEAVVATATARPLTPRAVEFIVTRGAWSQWWFPVLPVVALQTLAISDGAGGWLDQPLAGAWVQRTHDEPQLVLGPSWAGRGVRGDLLRVQAVVGGPDVETLHRLRQAIFLLAREWFDAGVLIEGEPLPRLSFGVGALIRQARYRRPCEVA